LFRVRLAQNKSLREEGIDFIVKIKGKRLQSQLVTFRTDVARRE
jgi:hypothetical protein